MPQPPNKALRIIVPILLIIGGVFVAWAVYTNSTKQGSGNPKSGSSATTTPDSKTPATGDANKPADSSTIPPVAETSKQDAPATDTAAPGEKPATPPSAPSTPTDQAATTPPSTPTAGDTASKPKFVAVFNSGPFPTLAPIGNLSAPYRMKVQFSPLGAGIASIELTDIYATIARTDSEQVQAFVPHPTIARLGIVPFALDVIEINGELVGLFGKSDQDGSYWTQTEATPSKATFEATINDASGTPAVKITRSYSIEPDSYDLTLQQRATNLTAKPMTIIWREYGPADLHKGLIRTTDYRRIRFGYLTDPATDPTQQIVKADRFVESRPHWLGSPTSSVPGSTLRVWEPKTLWPNTESTSKKFTPVWVAMTNRHFVVAMHTLLDPAAPAGTIHKKSLPLASKVDRYVMDGLTPENETMVTYLTSEQATVAAGTTGIFDTGIYAGPLSPKFMTTKAEPRAKLVSLAEVVVYTMGGPCWWCTFQWLTHPLQWFLTFLHDNIVFDYSLAIIVLVICVRTLLHPVTKWSQVNMMRFSKQMANLGPKQKKLQEKYKDDPVRMRQELAQLMREENISYKGLLGCFPAFLQTPVWIALYAMLFFMYELRHEPGFFGVFQSVGSWKFLADLSEPDHFIPLGFSVNLPLLGLVDSINILPVLLGVVFYIQQKYLTPPPSTPLTPEQEQQQKIVKVMMVVLFPLMMYNTPSALVLYFIVNSTLGTLESRYIRRHVNEKDLARKPDVVDVYNKLGKGGGKPAKQPGFFARLQQMAEERAKQVDDIKRRQGRK